MPADKVKRKAESNAEKGSRSVGTIYQLRMQLPYIEPAIWRRVEVPGALTFDDLHYVIQVAMGWEDDHLWVFHVGDTEISPELDRFPFPGRPQPRPSHSTTLDEMLAGRRIRFRYEYNMGDSWVHEIKVERTSAAEPHASYPRCTDGARACPPEDCGGFGGYQNLLDAVANPKHPDRDELLEWIGGEWDPEAFDIDAVNAKLQPRKRRVAARPKKKQT